MGSNSGVTTNMDERLPLLQNAPDLKPNTSLTFDQSPATSASATGGFSEAFTKRVIRKIDRRLLPILFITFILNFINKAALSSASVYGLSSDINLSGGRYAWASSIFYFGYLFWAYPTTILIQIFPVGKYVGATLVIWGAVVAVTGLCSSYGLFLVARFSTGALEATISPAALYITAMWYTRDETPSRMGVWFSGTCAGGAIVNLLSWAIGHIQSTLTPWRWIYLIFGLFTLVWGIVVIFLLPDTILDSKFLTVNETSTAEARVAETATGITTSEQDQWDLKEAFACLLDPKTWFFFSISIFTDIPNGGIQTFINLVVKGFGYTSFESSLILAPISLLSFSVILGTGWLATRYKDITTYMISTFAIPAILGTILMTLGNARGLKLCGIYLISLAPGTMPLTMSLISGNVRSVTQKMTMTAVMLIAYCTGNIIGPQLFRSSEAPHYSTAFKLIAISYALASLSSLGLRFYMAGANKKWDAEERPPTPPTPIVEFYTEYSESESDPTTSSESRIPESARGFRYRL